ncbi:hypothetical protein [Trabulsiella odontotermitis]|uniref:hypothetical protein n=1 Tax=Trabulsiella odontotermitis TaxID=379893 RepID=UPI00067656AB|nr:hypothetical protein [Trabulsiella odontotermitis]KNC91306.1 hypothetical protein GM30_23580 [Trabulsiella odontotermitis]
MADWGALLATENGAPFITPQSIPLALFSRKTAAISATSGAVTTVTQTFTADRPIIPFVSCTVSCVVSYKVSGTTCTVSIANATAAGGTAYVYFFTIFAQPLPEWGIAIWDEQGTCILTNETRVLTDIEAVGTNGSDPAGGFNINTTKPGKYGIVPAMSGLVTGVITSGGTRPYSSQYFFRATWNGSSTVLSSALTNGPPPAGTTNVTYHNMRNQVYALNLASYD